MVVIWKCSQSELGEKKFELRDEVSSLLFICPYAWQVETPLLAVREGASGEAGSLTLSSRGRRVLRGHVRVRI